MSLLKWITRWILGSLDRADYISHVRRVQQDELNRRNDYWKDSLSHYRSRTWT